MSHRYSKVASSIVDILPEKILKDLREKAQASGRPLRKALKELEKDLQKKIHDSDVRIHQDQLRGRGNNNEKNEGNI